ncbi:hypothetical protein HMPREF1613_03493 [Escherichia coli 908616]|nr:hypothetical protein HMPREF9552_04409 [Escherichia coli MS 198-1]ESA79166.1 hypothetical protein HMPREF1599_05521 [Escherichia coli 907713]ESD18000.1 hypothetical protein HMPREF1600_05456 [Escherichia coli 907715]ESD48383.1 hypothetical protein HMPREF1605_04284 [Escherichia coli 908521]ESD81643.1 hypothetical protein HMPREF1612_04979 [Escherichia coli 908585]ESD86510.1 hypothetical protein HMPREF1613_03493 [Escherichia coli 908616]KXG89618.1 hypothetical protein HMPREF3040_05438 [Escherich
MPNCLMRFAYQAYMKLHGFVGRIRRSRRIRQNNGHAVKI